MKIVWLMFILTQGSNVHFPVDHEFKTEKECESHAVIKNFKPIENFLPANISHIYCQKAFRSIK